MVEKQNLVFTLNNFIRAKRIKLDFSPFPLGTKGKKGET